MGRPVVDLLGGSNAVDVGHVDVHEDNVRIQLLGELDSFLARTSGADYLDICFELKELANVLPGIGDVIYD